MLNIAILKQDFLINKKTIMGCALAQFISLFLAVMIRNMRLIDISDIFWDTLPTVIIPMIMQMILAYEVVKKREADKTMAFILSTRIRPSEVIVTKAIFMIVSTFLLLVCSMAFGCLTHVYDLTGVWDGNRYIVLNLGAMCLQLFVGGWCFLVSCVERETKPLFYWKAGVGVVTLFYAVYLLYYTYPQRLFFLQYLTFFSLFRQELFAAGSLLTLPASVFLALLGLAFFVGGRILFCGRSMRI